MSENKTSCNFFIMSLEANVLKLGVKFKPPTVIILYKQSDTNKLRKRCMPIR